MVVMVVMMVVVVVVMCLFFCCFYKGICLRAGSVSGPFDTEDLKSSLAAPLSLFSGLALWRPQAFVHLHPRIASPS